MALVVRREQFSRLVIGRQRLHTLSTTFGTWHTHRHTRTGGRGTQLSLPHAILLLLPRRLPHHYFIGTGKKKKSTVPQIIWLNCRRGDLYNARQCRRRRKGHPLLLFHLSMRLTTFYSFSLWVFLILLLLFVFFLLFLSAVPAFISIWSRRQSGGFFTRILHHRPRMSRGVATGTVGRCYTRTPGTKVHNKR